MIRGQMGNMLAQAQKMQERFQKAQEELAQIEVEGVSGAGMDKAVATCAHQIKKIELSDDVIEEAKEDKTMLEDLVMAAVNDAMQKAEEAERRHLQKYTQGFNLPGGLDSLFK